MLRLREREEVPIAVVAAVLVALLAGCTTSPPARVGAPGAHDSGADGAPVSAADEVAVRGTFAALNSACATRDVDGFMRLFDDGDDVLLVGSDTGEVFHGRREIRGFVAQLYALPFRFSFDVDRTTVARHGDVAWAFVDGAMVHTGDQGGAAGRIARMPYRITVVMVRRADGWRWRLFHGAVPGGGA